MCPRAARIGYVAVVSGRNRARAAPVARPVPLPAPMTTLYWTCLVGGFVVTLVLLVVGEVLEAALDALDGALDALDLGDALDPLSAVAGATLFGGAGVLLDAFLDLPDVPEVAIAAAVGIVGAVALHALYVKPMRNSETSTGFSVREYVGKTGELTTGVPAGGFGEVVVRMGASTTFQTAASFSGDPIPTGTKVVVVEVDREGVLHVAPLEREDMLPVPDPAPPRLEAQ